MAAMTSSTAERMEGLEEGEAEVESSVHDAAPIDADPTEDPTLLPMGPSVRWQAPTPFDVLPADFVKPEYAQGRHLHTVQEEYASLGMAPPSAASTLRSTLSSLH